MKPLGSSTGLFALFQRTCVAYACVSLPLQAAFAPGRMISGSMTPTLIGREEAGDTVLVSKLTYRFRAPRRGDLVAFTDSDGVRAIKRVVGLPGEVVSIADGRVLIDGEALDAPPVFQTIEYRNKGAFANPRSKFRVKPGHYFVLGDDSADSYDSRYWGALSEDRIQGQAVAIVWPWPRLRLLAEES